MKVGKYKEVVTIDLLHNSEYLHEYAKMVCNNGFSNGSLGDFVGKNWKNLIVKR